MVTFEKWSRGLVWSGESKDFLESELDEVNGPDEAVWLDCVFEGI